MALTKLHPNGTDRRLMEAEFSIDLADGCFSCSPNLTDRACGEYPDLVLHTIRTGDNQSLESELLNGRIAETQRVGMHRSRRVNKAHAAQMLSEGTWNNLWCRAQCRQALATGSNTVTVIRAASRRNPRTASERLVGRHLNAGELLKDLRARACDHDAGRIPVPGGPMSGISVVAMPPGERT